MHAQRRPFVFASLAVATVATLAPGRPAQACGGFFCNRPTFDIALPVAQTAENVLFAMERAPDGQFRLEAHVQIFYTGPADRFSWVVPVDSKPELDVGSNLVFSTLLAATQPRFDLRYEDVGTCRPAPTPPPRDYALPGAAGPRLADAGAAADGATGVSVSFRGDVGPYDAAVIRSTDRRDPKPLIDWLNENKYFVSPEAERLIAEYVAEDKHFVAIRLLSGQGVNEIQPLVMRFAGPGPCVPLKLTSIAAIKDLRVNLWVLGDHRVVPDNFYEVVVNDAAIDWFTRGSNYEALIKRAADEAGGNAFVTEYAGPTTMLRGQLHQPGRYNLTVIRQAKTPPDALDQIAAQGFPRDATLLSVLQMQIPLPEALRARGITERDFYNRLRFYWQQFQKDFAPFDAAALASALEAKFITPLQKAQALVDRHAKLTRLATFISPEEMTVDPTFVMNPSLPDVPAVRSAVAYRVCGERRFTRCEAPVRLALPDGQSLWFAPTPQSSPCYGDYPDGGYQRGSLEEMPAVSVAWARSSDGAGAAKYDNQPAIKRAVEVHNASVAAAFTSKNAGGPPDAAFTPKNAGGPPGRDGGVSGDVPPVEGTTGCACSAPGAATGGAGAATIAVLVGFAALVTTRRRRRP